jgi:glycosyltransferase involved in cell wall biosynthesis
MAAGPRGRKKSIVFSRFEKLPDMNIPSDISASASDVNKPAARAEVEITLVVPVYNEEDNIVPFVREVAATLLIPHQIVIVFDHDEDSTIKKKDEVLRIDPSVVFIKNTAGSGIINALRTGFNVASTRYVVPIMADLSDTPATILEMYRTINQGYDLVVGSRYCAGGRKIGGPYVKYLLSIAANLSLQKITKIPTHGGASLRQPRSFQTFCFGRRRDISAPRPTKHLCFTRGRCQSRNSSMSCFLCSS